MPDKLPYDIICDHLKKGEVVPFLGAGASLSGRPINAVWDDKIANFLPTGSELAKRLADICAFPSDEPHDRGNLAKVASYYVVEPSDRRGLRARLCDLFDRDYQIGEVHRFLADLPVPLLIVTTNYDDLLEKVFKDKRKPYHLIVHPTDQKALGNSVLWWKPGQIEPEVQHTPNNLPLKLTDTTIIYKMHGGVDRLLKKWNSFVITEEDYVEFLARMTKDSPIPKNFLLHFRERHFLFLGYGLHDWNLRVMLTNLNAALVKPRKGAAKRELMPANGLRSWAIQHPSTELEKTLWRKRNVSIYDIEIDMFASKMRELMKQ